MKDMKNRFILCGILGWCMEIVFTSVHCLAARDSRLMGHTSLWMFPIYGLASCIYPLNRLLGRLPFWMRGMLYSGGILSVEYASGMLLKHFSCCPWDYAGAKYNIKGVIRLDYAPFWAAAGLLFEKILLSRPSPFTAETGEHSFGHTA